MGVPALAAEPFVPGDPPTLIILSPSVAASAVQESRDGRADTLLNGYALSYSQVQKLYSDHLPIRIIVRVMPVALQTLSNSVVWCQT